MSSERSNGLQQLISVRKLFIRNYSARRTRHHGAIAGKWSSQNNSAFGKIHISTTVKYMTQIL